MQKRYQVFVSSTFTDLEEERREIMKALLELRCIPAGMEMFPAANDEQWRLIQRVIDDSDYYVVIVAGRYGSTDAAGLSYTEKEYRYAVKKGIPVYGFVHKNPEKIAGEKLEKSLKARKKLEAFRKLVQSNKMVKYWETAEGLGGAVSRAISIAEKDEPRKGWVRGDKLLTEEHVQQMLDLQKQVRDLQAKLDAASGPPPGVENLAQGDDTIMLAARGWRDTYSREWDRTGDKTEIVASWNELFEALAPLLSSQATKQGWKAALDNKCMEIHRFAVAEAEKAGHYPSAKAIIELPEAEVARVINQFRALGLIKPRGAGSGFVLTSYGDRLALALSAIRKS